MTPRRNIAILSLLAAVILPITASAQQNPSSDIPIITPRQEALLRHSPRVPAVNRIWEDRSFSTVSEKNGTVSTKSGKAGTASSLPADRWFPGEWEEVQAICVTWPYNAYPAPDGTALTSQIADPVFSGVGYYYRNYNDYYDGNSYSFGPIIGVPDTEQSSFVLVFANLINAIQQGNAEAWVNVWQYSDTAIILRTMQRLNMPMTRYRWIQSYGNSFWYRDCGPICFYYGQQDSVGMLDFMYYPGRALDDSLPYAIEAQMGIPNWETTIEWEGGNCLVDGTGMVISSNAIYAANADVRGQLKWNGHDESTISYARKAAISNNATRDSLVRLLGPRATYILPKLTYDGGTGHIDLYADMLDENEFVFSKYPSRYSSWRDYKTVAKNIDSLCSYRTLFGHNYKHRYIPFPCTNSGGTFPSQATYNDNYTRTYSNHTFVNNVIIQPCFSNVVNGEPTSAWDRNRVDSIKMAYPGYTVYPVNVASFDGSGGAIHCITKQIPADNPVRILHSSITGNTGSDYLAANVPVTATITNRSGIASATLHYRMGDGQWQTAPLTHDGSNNYSGAIPTAALALSPDDNMRVDYYISATSNNGKTITKPFTATNSGHYTFYLGNNPNLPIQLPLTDTPAFGHFYPNPSNGVANIELSLPSPQTFTVTIVNTLGQTVHSSTLEADGHILYTIDTQRLRKGVYTVLLAADNSTAPIARRIVVQ